MTHDPGAGRTFSLVVPTLGRSGEVKALLASIAAHGGKDVEVVLVDQNQDGRLDWATPEFGDRFPLRHLRVAFKGAARARNHGARFATGRYINFPDDDCTLMPNTIPIATQLLADLDLKVLIGMSVDGSGGDSTAAFARDERTLNPRTMWGRSIEFTMFFDRRVFADVGGYDERFGPGSVYGSGEGPEILIRILRALPAGSVYYSHRLRFLHPNKSRDFTDAGARREFSYARGHGALFAKWPLPSVAPEMVRYGASSALGSVVFSGGKRRMYRERLRGFLEGFREFRREARVSATARGKA